MKSLKRRNFNPLCCFLKCMCCVYSRILARICSIQVCLSSMFCMSMACLGSSIIVIFYVYSMDNVNEIFIKNQKTVISYTEHFQNSWLEQGPRILSVLERWMRYHEMEEGFNLDFPYNDTKPIDRLTRLMYSLHKSTAGHVYSIVYCSMKGGGLGVRTGVRLYQNVSENPDSCCPYTIEEVDALSVTENYPGPLYGKVINDDLRYGADFIDRRMYDMRLVTWYLTSSAYPTSQDFFWKHSLGDDGKITSTLSKNMIDSGGSFRGVLGVVISLDNFRNFLGNLDLEPGIFFLVDQMNGKLIASTSGVEIYEESGGKKVRISPEDTEVTIFKDAMKFMKEEYSETGSVQDITDIDRTEFKSHNGDLWYIIARSVDITGGFKILNVYIAKDYDIFRNIYLAQRITISLGVSILVSLSLLSYFMICIVLLPLNVLSRQMRKIETMKLSEISFRLSCFLEIRKIQQRFRYCVKKLEEFRCFLPDYVVKNTEEENAKLDRQSELIERDEMELLMHNGASPTISEAGDEDDEEDDEFKHVGKGRAGRRGGILGMGLRNQGGQGSWGKRSNSEGYGSEDDVSLSSYQGSLSVAAPRARFELGLRKRVVLCVYIWICNWKEVFQVNPKRFTRKYSEFLEIVTSTTQKSGSILSFEMNRVVLYYHQLQVTDAIRNVQKMQKMMFKKRWKFRVIIAMALDFSIHGVIGTNKLKTNTIFDGVVEKAKYMVECYRSSVLQGRVPRITVLLDSNIERKSRNLKIFHNPSNLDIPDENKSKMSRVKGILLAAKKMKKGGNDKDDNTLFTGGRVVRPCNVFLAPSERSSRGRIGFGPCSYRDFMVVFKLCSPCGGDDVLVGKTTNWMNDMEKMKAEDSFNNLNKGFLYMVNEKYSAAKKSLQKSVIAGEGGVWKSSSECELEITAEKLLAIMEMIKTGEVDSFDDYLTNNADEMEAERFLKLDRSLLFSVGEKRQFLKDLGLEEYKDYVPEVVVVEENAENVVGGSGNPNKKKGVTEDQEK